MKIEHFAINVKDPKAIAAWWEKNLGIKIIRADQEPPYIHFLADDNDETLIELYANDAGEYMEYGALSHFTFHIAFATDKIIEESERLMAAGATAGSDMITLGNGDKFQIVRDPWGIAIQIIQRTTPLF